MKFSIVRPEKIAPFIVLTFLSAPAAFADSPFTVHHMRGPVSQRESQISREIQCAFDAGLINGYEMAQLQRDLDGARAEGNYFAIDSTSGSNAAIIRKLDQIESVLDAHAANNLTWEVALVQK
ncbi:MAG: hypothetical protein K2Y39_22625 [Candidatus Obscuribacterales bacterium]|nr:hypothetical protein [Candidatus Obscuribacterales bacterium]